MIKHIPNFFTILRIIASPLISILLLLNNQSYWAFIFFVIAASTDWVDGFLARLLNATSELGAKLDLLADKLLVGLVLPIIAITNIELNLIFKIIIALILFATTSIRDYFVTDWRKQLDRINIKMPASFMAKTKTAIILIGMGMVLSANYLGQIFNPLGWLIIFLGAVMSIITMMQYLKVFNQNKNH